MLKNILQVGTTANVTIKKDYGNNTSNGRFPYNHRVRCPLENTRSFKLGYAGGTIYSTSECLIRERSPNSRWIRYIKVWSHNFLIQLWIIY